MLFRAEGFWAACLGLIRLRLYRLGFRIEALGLGLWVGFYFLVDRRCGNFWVFCDNTRSNICVVPTKGPAR